VDLLDLLLHDEGTRQELREALGHFESGPDLHEVNFDTYDAVLDREVGEARVFDVLDGTAGPTIVTLDELRRRLA
jgi:hypothetical protein